MLHIFRHLYLIIIIKKRKKKKIHVSLFRGGRGWDFKILQEIIDRSIVENAFLFGR
jgi:hypothetical protein